MRRSKGWTTGLYLRVGAAKDLWPRKVRVRVRVWAHHGLMDDHEGGEDGGAAARQGSVQPLAVDDVHEDAAPEHGAENGAEAKEVEAGSVLAGVVARLVVVAPGKFSA